MSLVAEKWQGWKRPVDILGYLVVTSVVKAIELSPEIVLGHS